jgi:hypothetical protein
VDRLSQPVLRIRDVYPESLFFSQPKSRIPDLGSRIQQQQKRGGEKIFVFPFFVVINCTKLEIFKFLVLLRDVQPPQLPALSLLLN